MSASNLVYLQQGPDGMWRAWHGYASDENQMPPGATRLIVETSSRADAIVAAHDWTTKNTVEYGIVELDPQRTPHSPLEDIDLRAESRFLRKQLAELCDALLRQHTERDGNWGYLSFHDEVRQIAAALANPSHLASHPEEE